MNICSDCKKKYNLNIEPKEDNCIICEKDIMLNMIMDLFNKKRTNPMSYETLKFISGL